MKAETLKRLFSALERGSSPQVRKVAEVIVQEERSKNHGRLADQLSKFLPGIGKDDSKTTRTKISTLQELPTSRRHSLPLINVIERDTLKHHMILNPDAEERFSRIEKEYVAQERLAKFGLKPKKKILLYGNPGCGKTMGAERLAWSLGLPLHRVRFDSLISSYLGESMANLRAVFEHSSHYPRLLLLDECDFIAKSRNLGKDVGEINRIVNTLLQLLEEYNAPGLLLATTNLDESLDKALFRRFDDVFELPMPTAKEIVLLLQQTLSFIATEKRINWDLLANKMKKCSCAQVVQIANEAAKICVLSEKHIIRQKDIEQALKEIGKLN